MSSTLDDSIIESKTVKELVILLNEHGVETPQTRQVKSFYIDLYNKHVKPKLQSQPPQSGDSPTSSNPPTITEPSRRSTTQVRTRKVKTPKRVRPLDLDADTESQPSKKARVDEEDSDVTMSEPPSENSSVVPSSDPVQEAPPISADQQQPSVSSEPVSEDTFKIPPSQRMRSLSVSTEQNQLRNRMSVGTPYPSADNDVQIRQNFGKVYTSPEMAKNLNSASEQRQPTPTPAVKQATPQPRQTPTFTSPKVHTPNQSMIGDVSIISLHTPAPRTEVIPNSPGLSPARYKQLAPPPSQILYSFAQKILTVVIGILVFMALFLAYTYSNPAMDLPFCDNDTVFDPSVNCRKCPSNGICAGGELQTCKPGYINTGNVCVKDKLIVECASQFLNQLKETMSQETAKKICEGTRVERYTEDDIKKKFDDYAKLNTDQDKMELCKEEVMNILNNEPESFSITSSSTPWSANTSEAQTDTTPRTYTSTLPDFSIGCQIQQIWIHHKIPILLSILIVLLSLAANLYQQQKYHREAQVQSIVSMVMEKLQLMGTNKLIAVSSIKNDIERELSSSGDEEQVQLSKLVEKLWPNVEAQVNKMSQVEERNLEGISCWALQGTFESPATNSATFMNNLENANEMYPSPAKSPSEIPVDQ